MKKIILLLSLIALASCGKNNKVNTGTATTSGTSTYSTTPTNTALANFEGTYDIIRMQSNDCGASIQLVRDCDGLKLLSNNNMGAEEFCNVNRGERRNQRDNSISTTVTLEGNVLKAVTTLRSDDRMNNRLPGPGERPGPADSQVNFTNTLTLNSDGTLTKISHLKSRESRCLYQKR